MLSSRTYGKDIFERATKFTNIFMTIHGPLNYSERTINERKLGVVPDNCILVIITLTSNSLFKSTK